VLNLAINARDAMEIGGTLKVSTGNVRLGPPRAAEEPAAGEYVVICVSDSGSGMDPEVRAKVFEPFFTTKEVGKGSGLGLSQVLGFAKQSGGGVRIESTPGVGTSVRIFLPRADRRPQLEPAAATGDAPETATGAVILVVDDDSAVRDVTAAMLRDLGYKVEEAESGESALRLIDDQRHIDLAVIDFAMPAMSGAELARHVRAQRPSLPVLFVTGFAERESLTGISDRYIVSKPFLNGELAEKVRLALTN
jgi:CheY-like chemotaxis protein